MKSNCAPYDIAWHGCAGEAGEVHWIRGMVVALTGFEPEGCQFSPVQLGLCICKHVQVDLPGCSGMGYGTATLSLGCHSVPPEGGAKHAVRDEWAAQFPS